MTTATQHHLHEPLVLDGIPLDDLIPLDQHPLAPGRRGPKPPCQHLHQSVGGVCVDCWKRVS